MKPWHITDAQYVVAGTTVPLSFLCSEKWGELPFGSVDNGYNFCEVPLEGRSKGQHHCKQSGDTHVYKQQRKCPIEWNRPHHQRRVSTAVRPGAAAGDPSRGPGAAQPPDRKNTVLPMLCAEREQMHRRKYGFFLLRREWGCRQW